MAFENLFGNIDYGMVPRSQQGSVDRTNQAIGKGIGIYERAQDRDTKKRQLEIEAQKEQAEAATDIKALSQAGYMKIAGGQQPTPQEVQAMDVAAAMMKPQGYVNQLGEPVVQQPVDPRTQLQGAMGSMAEPSPVQIDMSTAVPADTQPAPIATVREPSLMTPEQFQQAKMPKLEGPLVGTPKGLIMEGQAGLDVQKSKILNSIKSASAELKENKGREKVASVLKRMGEINDSLKDKGAIVSGDASIGENISRYAATTGAGQEVRKVTNPQTQALAEEYTKLQSTLLPYYASAAGLGAKSLDSEGERKSILGSFGDPSGIYESNRKQLETLKGLFNVENGKKPSQAGVTSYMDYFK